MSPNVSWLAAKISCLDEGSVFSESVSFCIKLSSKGEGNEASTGVKWYSSSDNDCSGIPGVTSKMGGDITFPGLS